MNETRIVLALRPRGAPESSRRDERRELRNQACALVSFDSAPAA
jgi:hypothetical protein